MRILIFNIYFHPDPTGTGLVMTQLAQDLAARGHQVTVITSMPHYGLDSIRPEFAGKLFHREQFDGISIWRTFVYVSAKKTFLSRLINYFSYTLLSLVAGLMAGKHDAVMCVSPPITVAASAYLVSCLRGGRLILNVQDVYPDSVFPNRLAARINRCLERFACRVARQILVISPGARQYLLEKGVPDHKIRRIPNWTDVDEIQPLEKHNAFRSTHHLDGHFVVLYAGNMGVLSGLGVALEAAARLQEHTHIQFLFVGQGNAADPLKRRAAELNLDNVRFLPTQPREMLPQMMAASDLSLVALDPRVSTSSVPSKVYTIMASGRAVLAAVHPDNEVARLVREVGCGLCVSPDSPEDMAAAILEASRDPARLLEHGRRGRHYVAAHHARWDLTGQYHDLLTDAARP